MSVLSITASLVVPSANAQLRNNVVAAVAVTAGQTVYKLANNTYGLCQANGSSPAYFPSGIAVDSAAAGEPFTFVISDPELTIGATLLAGVPYFTSGTAGGISPFGDLTTGWFVTPLGVGNADGTLNFSIGGTSTGAHA